jgi:hypothetical protein
VDRSELAGGEGASFWTKFFGIKHIKFSIGFCERAEVLENMI